MKKGNQVVLAVGSILALLLSIPLDWFSINGHMGNGMSASLTFFVKLPIWLVVVLGAIGVLLSLLNSLGLTSIPKFACLGFLLVATLYVFIALVMLPSQGGVNLEVGPFLAFSGLVLGYCHVKSGSCNSAQQPSPDEALETK
jgi:hypothetical protein